MLVVDHDSLLAGQVQVSLIVDGHPVRPARTKQLAIHESTVVGNRILIGLGVADVRNEEQSSFRVANDPVGLNKRVVHERYVRAIAIGAINSLFVLRPGFMFPPFPLVVRISKVHSAIGIDPNVVWAVELSLFKGAEKDTMRLVGGDFPHFILFVGTRDQLSIWCKEHSVASPGRFQELRNFFIQVHFQNAVVGLIGKEHIPLRVYGGPFRELIPIGYERYFAVGSFGDTIVTKPEMGAVS